MSGVLFYITTIGFALGVFIRSFVFVGLPEVVWLLLISFVLAVLYRRKETAIYLLYTSVFLFICCLGVLRMEVANTHAVNPFYESQINQEIQIEGVVAREVDIRENSAHVYLRTDNGLVLIIAERFSGVSYGDVLQATGVLSKPAPFETDLGRTFNYPGYLQAQGVSYTMRYADIAKTGEGEGNVLIAALLNAKHAFMDVVESLIPEPQAGLSEGLLLGVKRALGEDLEDAFRVTGIIHIVVLSGYNIMLVVTFVLYVLSYILPFRTRLIVGGVSIVCFALIVGLSATVVRASLMAALALIAKGTERTYAVLRALTVAGVVMVVINPYLLAFDVGFQLSFIATLGLVVLAPYMEKNCSVFPMRCLACEKYWLPHWQHKYLYCRFCCIKWGSSLLLLW